MPLDGAKLICLSDDCENPIDAIPAHGKTFKFGYYMDCDVVLEHPNALGVHCTIDCDAFGRVTIENLCPEQLITLNGKPLKILRPLLHNTEICILDKKFLWQFEGSEGASDLLTPEKGAKKAEQPPSSDPGRKWRTQFNKRLTIHSFAYCIKATDTPQDVEITTPDENKPVNAREETDLEAETTFKRLSPSPPPSGTDLIDLKTPKLPRQRSIVGQNTSMSSCSLSETVITSYSPSVQPNAQLLKSFAVVQSPKAVNPKKITSVPDVSLGPFQHTQSPLAMNHRPSMHLIDLTTPMKRPPPQSSPSRSVLKSTLKRNMSKAKPQSRSVANTSATSTESSVYSVHSTDGSVIELSDDGSFSPSPVPKTPPRSRTPQSLMKRAILSSAKKAITKPLQPPAAPPPSTLLSPKTPKATLSASRGVRFQSQSTPQRKSFGRIQSPGGSGKLSLSMTAKSGKSMITSTPFRGGESTPATSRTLASVRSPSTSMIAVKNKSRNSMMLKQALSKSPKKQSAQKSVVILDETQSPARARKSVTFLDRIVGESGEENPTMNETFSVGESVVNVVMADEQVDVDKNEVKAKDATFSPEKDSGKTNVAVDGENEDKDKDEVEVKEVAFSMDKYKVETKEATFSMEKTDVPVDDQDKNEVKAKDATFSPRKDCGKADVPLEVETDQDKEELKESSSEKVDKCEVPVAVAEDQNKDPLKVKEASISTEKDSKKMKQGEDAEKKPEKVGAAEKLLTTPRKSARPLGRETPSPKDKSLKKRSVFKPLPGVSVSPRGERSATHTVLNVTFSPDKLEVFTKSPVKEEVPELIPQTPKSAKHSETPAVHLDIAEDLPVHDLVETDDFEGLDAIFKTPKAKNLMILSSPKSISLQKPATDSLELVPPSTEFELSTNLDEIFKTPHSEFIESQVDEDTPTSTVVVETTTVLSPEEAFDTLAGRPINRNRSYVRKSTSKTPKISPLDAPRDEDLPKTDIEDWIETVNESVELLDDDEEEDEVSYFTATQEFSRDPLLTGSVTGTKEKKAGKSPRDESVITIPEEDEDECAEDVDADGEMDPLAVASPKRSISPNISGIDMLDHTSDSLFSETLAVSDEDDNKEADNVVDEPQQDEAPSLVEEPLQISPDKARKEMEEAFKNFEKERRILEHKRLVSTPEQRKTPSKLAKRRTLGNQQTLDVFFDVRAIKQKRDMEAEFEKFEEEPKRSASERLVRTPNETKSRRKDLRKTMGNNLDVEVKLDLNVVKEEREMELAFENFEEKPGFSEKRAVKTPELKKTSVKDHRRTMGSSLVTDVKLDLQAAKEQREMELAFENFIEEPEFSEERVVKTPEPKKAPMKDHRRTMGSSLVTDVKLDLQAAKEQREMELAFENFEEEPEFSEERVVKTPEPKKAPVKDHRRTMGSSLVTDVKLDLQAAKEQREMELAFENFEEEPEFSEERVVKTPEPKKAPMKDHRRTMGSSLVTDVKLDLKAAKEQREMELAFENFEEEPEFSEERVVKTPEPKKAPVKDHRRTMGSSLVTDVKLDLKAAKEQREMELAFENFEEEPEFSEERVVKTPEPKKAPMKDHRRTLGSSLVTDVKLDLQAAKEQREMELAFENFEEEPEFSEERVVKTPEPKKAPMKDHRRTMGSSLVTDVKLDLQAAKEQREMELAFENFEEEPEFSEERVVKTPEPKKVPVKHHRRTLGSSLVTEVKLDLKAAKEQREMELAFENFEEEPEFSEERVVKTPEPKKATMKDHRRTLGSSLVTEVKLDLKAAKEQREMELAFENFEEEPEFSAERVVKTPGSKKAPVKDHRRTMGSSLVTDVKLDLQAAKEQREMELAFENFEEEPEFSEERVVMTPEPKKAPMKDHRRTMGSSLVTEVKLDLKAAKQQQEKELASNEAVEAIEQDPEVSSVNEEIVAESDEAPPETLTLIEKVEEEVERTQLKELQSSAIVAVQPRSQKNLKRADKSDEGQTQTPTIVSQPRSRRRRDNALHDKAANVVVHSRENMEPQGREEVDVKIDEKKMEVQDDLVLDTEVTEGALTTSEENTKADEDTPTNADSHDTEAQHEQVCTTVGSQSSKAQQKQVPASTKNHTSEAQYDQVSTDDEAKHERTTRWKRLPKAATDAATLGETELHPHLEPIAESTESKLEPNLQEDVSSKPELNLNAEVDDTQVSSSTVRARTVQLSVVVRETKEQKSDVESSEEIQQKVDFDEMIPSTPLPTNTRGRRQQKKPQSIEVAAPALRRTRRGSVQEVDDVIRATPSKAVETIKELEVQDSAPNERAGRRRGGRNNADIEDVVPSTPVQSTRGLRGGALKAETVTITNTTTSGVEETGEEDVSSQAAEQLVKNVSPVLETLDLKDNKTVKDPGLEIETSDSKDNETVKQASRIAETSDSNNADHETNEEDVDAEDADVEEVPSTPVQPTRRGRKVAVKLNLMQAAAEVNSPVVISRRRGRKANQIEETNVEEEAVPTQKLTIEDDDKQPEEKVQSTLVQPLKGAEEDDKQPVDQIQVTLVPPLNGAEDDDKKSEEAIQTPAVLPSKGAGNDDKDHEETIQATPVPPSKRRGRKEALKSEEQASSSKKLTPARRGGRRKVAENLEQSSTTDDTTSMEDDVHKVQMKTEPIDVEEVSVAARVRTRRGTHIESLEPPASADVPSRAGRRVASKVESADIHSSTPVRRGGRKKAVEESEQSSAPRDDHGEPEIEVKTEIPEIHDELPPPPSLPARVLTRRATQIEAAESPAALPVRGGRRGAHILDTEQTPKQSSTPARGGGRPKRGHNSTVEDTTSNDEQHTTGPQIPEDSSVSGDVLKVRGRRGAVKTEPAEVATPEGQSANRQRRKPAVKSESVTEKATSRAGGQRKGVESVPDSTTTEGSAQEEEHLDEKKDDVKEAGITKTRARRGGRKAEVVQIAKVAEAVEVVEEPDTEQSSPLEQPELSVTEPTPEKKITTRKRGRRGVVEEETEDESVTRSKKRGRKAEATNALDSSSKADTEEVSDAEKPKISSKKRGRQAATKVTDPASPSSTPVRKRGRKDATAEDSNTTVDSQTSTSRSRKIDTPKKPTRGKKKVEEKSEEETGNETPAASKPIRRRRGEEPSVPTEKQKSNDVVEPEKLTRGRKRLASAKEEHDEVKEQQQKNPVRGRKAVAKKDISVDVSSLTEDEPAPAKTKTTRGQKEASDPEESTTTSTARGRRGKAEPVASEDEVTEKKPTRGRKAPQPKAEAITEVVTDESASATKKPTRSRAAKASKDTDDEHEVQKKPSRARRAPEPAKEKEESEQEPAAKRANRRNLQVPTEDTPTKRLRRKPNILLSDEFVH